MDSPLRISSIQVSSYKALKEQHGGYVKLFLVVQGRTRFMHPLSVENESYPIFNLATRYSVLLNFHLELKELFTVLPSFPKKKWLGGHSEDFLNKRVSQLNEYFVQILQNPLVNPSEPLMRLISPPRPYNLVVVGSAGAGKQYLVELFLKSDTQVLPGQTRSSMCGPEIMKYTPIDLLIDEKLYRISNLAIKTFTGTEETERGFLNEALANSHAVVFMYKTRDTEGYQVANRMYQKNKGSIPCILVNCEREYLGEFCVRNPAEAYNVFVAIIKEKNQDDVKFAAN